MGFFNKKKILLLMPTHVDLYRLVIKNLELLEYDVVYFDEKDFKYKNVFQRIDNFFRKTFLKQKEHKSLLKMKDREEQFIQTIYNKGEKFDIALVIRPDLYGENIPKLLQNICEKTIAYQWDGFSKFQLKDEVIEAYDVFATFDKADYDQYSDKFPNLVLTQNFYLHSTKNPTRKYDFYYVGSLQDDRLNIIQKLSNILKSGNYNNSFTLFDTKGKIEQKISNDIYITKEYTSYEKNLENSSEAEVIVDIKYPDHNGLSLRFFEALYFSQKIITNNSYIQNMDFYNENNHLIFDNIEHLNMETIQEFLKKPYVEPAKEIRERYSFKNWLEELISK